MNARSQCVASHTIYALSNTNARIQFTVYSKSCNTSTTTNPQLVLGAQFSKCIDSGPRNNIWHSPIYKKRVCLHKLETFNVFVDFAFVWSLQKNLLSQTCKNLKDGSPKKIWWKGRWWWRRWLWTAIWAGVTVVVRRWSRIVISCDRLSPAISHYRLTTSST